MKVAANTPHHTTNHFQNGSQVSHSLYTKATEAAKDNDLETLKSLSPEELTTIDRYLRTPLTIAAIHGNLEAIQLLYDLLGKLHFLQSDRMEVTPAMAAAQYGQIKVLRFLHAQDESLLLTKGSNNCHIANAAAAGRQLGVLTYLHDTFGLEKGLLNTPNCCGDTPATIAAQVGDGEIVKFLHNINVDLNVFSTHGESLATIAASLGHKQVLETLKQIGQDLSLVDQTGTTPKEAASKVLPRESEELKRRKQEVANYLKDIGL